MVVHDRRPPRHQFPLYSVHKGPGAAKLLKFLNQPSFTTARRVVGVDSKRRCGHSLKGF